MPIKIKRIVLFLNTTLTERDYQRFGIELLKEYFDIIFIDFTKYLYPLVKDNTYEKKSVISFEYIVIKNKDDIKSVLNSLHQSDHVISFFHYNKNTYPIFRELSNNGLEYSIFMMNGVPIPKSQGQRKGYTFELIKNKLGVQLLKTIINRFYNNPKIAKYLLGIKSPKYCLLGGSECKNIYSDYKLRNKRTKDLKLHTLDYNDYLLIKDLKSSTPYIDKYVLFIDAPGPLFFGDLLTQGRTKSILTVENYYTAITNFFSFVEKKFNLNVVIAGHPVTKHNRFPDYYGSREVFYNKTAELIKNSEFVIDRDSTAIGFAVLFKKPIIIFTTNELQSYFRSKYSIASFASCFGKNPINLDSDYSNINLEDELYVDEHLYTDYKSKYIKMRGSENLNSWSIVAKELLTN